MSKLLPGSDLKKVSMAHPDALFALTQEAAHASPRLRERRGSYQPSVRGGDDSRISQTCFQDWVPTSIF